MKTRILLCLMFSLFFSTSYAHKEWVHQYIVQQAYNLLANHYEFNLPEIDAHMGSTGPGEGPWITGSILTGAWREDMEDLIGNSGSFSGNHFWDADISDRQTNWIATLGNQINSYQKVLKFAYGGWTLKYLPPGTGETQVYEYISLVDLYENGNLHKVGYHSVAGDFFPADIWFIASTDLKNKLVWEILGRMCHLLADMSVPAHVHFDQHNCGFPHFEPDEYEVLIGGSSYGQCNTQGSGTNYYLNYDSQTAFDNGGFINPYSFDLNNPLRYLFYTTNQIADHFPSSFPYKPGDNNPFNNPYPGTEEILNAMGPSPNSVDIIQIADVCMNQAIRATAGLLYWFAIECDMMKSVTIASSSQVDDHVQVRNPAGTGIYEWVATPYTLEFENSITLDLMGDPWATEAFLGWEKRDRYNVNIGFNSQIEWLNANATATSTFIANYTPWVTVSLEQIQIESSNVNAHYKNITTGEISSSFTFPRGYPITVAAVAPQDYLFLGWSDANGFIGGPNPASFNPPPNISGVYATFKKIGASNSPDAYANNNQRKFVKNYSGVLFSVYSSMEKVWIEYSTNNGQTWQLGNDEKPLFEGLQAKNPSIEFWNKEIDETQLLVAAQVNINGEADIQISRLRWKQNSYLFSERNHIPLDNNQVFWPGFSYSETNLNPVIGMIDPGRLLIAVDLLDVGKAIWFQAGTLIGNYSIEWFDSDWITSLNQISNVSIYSTKLDYDISQSDEYVCWIAYEEKIGSSSSKIVVTKAYMSSSSNVSFTPPVIVSENNGFSKNYSPSITAWLEGETNDCAAVVWIAYRRAYVNNPINQSAGETKVFLRTYSNGSWSPDFNTYGSNINTVNVNKNSNNSFAFAWSEGRNNINYYVKSNNLTTVYTTNTSGKDLQVGNFASLNSMRLNSFKTSIIPYDFELSNTFGNNQEEEFSADRVGIIVKDTTAFYFAFGDIKVNDEVVDFIELPDTVTIDNKETLNTYLISDSFSLTDNTNFIYSVKFGVTDSVSAALTLNEGKSVQFKVQLIDDQTSEVLGTLDDIIFNSANILPYESISFQVNTQGIGNRTCRLKLTTEDNLEFNYSLVNSYNNDTTLSKRGFVEKTLILNGNEIVKTYALAQNFPNPFNPLTTIHYQLPKDGLVTLKIYDILGSVVKTLVNEERVAGKYEVSFNASSFASGVYLCKLNVNDYVDTKKMILLK